MSVALSIKSGFVSGRFWWSTPLIICIAAALLLSFLPYAFDVRPKYLKSDILIFILFALLFFWVAYIRQVQHLKVGWEQVFRNRVAMGCFVVLLFFLVITLLDCIHFQRQVSDPADSEKSYFKHDVVSVLDLILYPMMETQEQSYSAPFASFLFIKQNIDIAPGRIKRDYPPLKYGGSHLQPGDSRVADIATKAIKGVLIAVVSWFLLVAFLLLLISRFQLARIRAMFLAIVYNRTRIPWRVGLLTSLVIYTFLVILYYLSFYYHVFGTNQVGTDTLFEALKSIRTGVLIGTLTTLVMLPFAIFLGIAAGYFRKWTDDVIQFTYTVLNAIPSVLLIAAFMLIITVYIDNNAADFTLTAERGDIKLLALCAILGITSWTGLCRLLRGEALKIREVDYIQAAHAFGVGHGKVISRHILPNVMHIVMIVVVLDFSGLVLAEAVLSYIGIGVDPSMNSWGNMINSARLEMAREPMVWWSLVAAFIFMFTLVLAANLFADAVRDAFDPRLRKG